MSVVKKYKVGGVSTQNNYGDFADFIGKKLREEKVAGAALEPLQAAASNWAKLVNSANFEDVYKVDPITQKYTIDVTNAPPELQTIDWSGSEGAAKTNLLGQIPVKANVNTIMANWVNEYLQSKKQATPTSTTPTSSLLGKRSVGDLYDFTGKSLYGGRDDFDEMWARDLKNLDENQRKERVMNVAKDLLSGYGTNAEQGWEYNPIQNKDIILNAIENKDWDTFVSESQKLGWDPISMTLPKTQEQINQETQQGKIDKLQAFAKELTRKGVRADIVNQVIEQGYTDFSEGNLFSGAQDSPWLQEAINKKGFVLTDEDGRQLVIGKTGLFEQEFLDPDAEGYGTYFSQADGVPTLYQEGVEGYDPSKFKFQFEGERFRPIQGKVTGFEGWNIFGVPERGENGFNYTKTLILQDPQTKKEIELQYNQNGVYTRKDNGESVNVDIQRFAEGEGLRPAYLDYLTLSENDPFKPIQGTQPENTTATLNTADSILRGNITSETESIGKTISELKYISQNDPSYLVRSQASNKYIELLDKLQSQDKFAGHETKNIIRKIINNYLQVPEVPAPKDQSVLGKVGESLRSPDMQMYRKKGGILKAQSGTSLTAQEYLNKYANKPKEEPKESKTRDIRGTMADADFLDWLSVGGAASSLLPGVGMAGAAVTTVADIARDIRGDDDVTLGTHLMNLGFIGLSAIGLGGLRALKIGAQAASKAGKLQSLVKVVDKTEDAKDFASGVSKLMSKQGTISTYKAANITDKEFDLLKAAGIVNENTKLTTIIKKGTSDSAKTIFDQNIARGFTPSRITKEVKEFKPFVLKPQPPPVVPKDPSLAKRILLDETKGLRKLVGVLPGWEKIGKGAAQGLGVLGGANVLYSGANVVKGAAEAGTEGVQMQDLKNVLYGAGAVKGFLKNKGAIKEADTLRKAGTNDKVQLEIGKEKFALTKEVEAPNFKKPSIRKFGKDKEAIKTHNETEFNKFKSELEKALVDKSQVDKIKNLNIDDQFKINPAGKSEIMTLEESKLPKYEYERLRAILRGDVGSYLNQSWFRGYKEGGILKMQNSGIIPSLGRISPIYSQSSIATVPIFPRRKVDIYQVTNEDMALADKANANNLNPLASQMFMPKLGYTGKSGIIPTQPGQLAFKPQVGSTDIKHRGLGQLSGNLPKIDETDFLNLMGYAKTLEANKAIASAQKRAAMAGIMKFPTAPNQYVRATSSTMPFYQKEAARLNTLGKRMASSTTDIDRGMSARLAAEAQGSGLLEKGMLSDQQLINQQLDKQGQLNRQTQLANLDISAKNLASAAEGERNIHLVGANQKLADNTAFQNLIRGYAANKQIKDERSRYQQYYDKVTDPAYRDKMKSLEDLRTQEAEAKKRWEAAAAADNTSVTTTTWEESAEAQDFKNRMKILTEEIQNEQYNLSNLGMALRLPGVRMNKKGSKLEERKELSRYNREARRSEKMVELEYKNILKNNELMQKSLIKIFK